MPLGEGHNCEDEKYDPSKAHQNRHDNVEDIEAREVKDVGEFTDGSNPTDCRKD